MAFKKISDENVVWISNHIGILCEGQYIFRSLLWVDFEELTNFPNFDYPKQVVGHTHQDNVNIIGNSESEIIGIDMYTIVPKNKNPYYEQLGSSEILLYENDKIESLSLNWKSADIIKKIDYQFNRILHE